MTASDEGTRAYADSVSVAECARKGGMRTMTDDANDKVKLGLTDAAEILRVLY